MIRLRDTIERACAHPLLGPFVILLLVFALALVFVHVLAEGAEASELGQLCVALAAVLGTLVLITKRSLIPRMLVVEVPARAPPGQPTPPPATAPPWTAAIPLRR